MLIMVKNMAFSRMVLRKPLNGGISNFARPMGYLHRPLSGPSVFSRIMTSQKGKSEWRSVCGVKHQAFFSTMGRIQNQHKDKSEKNNSKITKAALLSQASNRFSKFLIHIKWPLMRNNRPFTMDDFSAFFSWLVMGNVLWIILGTTTFGLVTMYSIHTFDNIRNSIKTYYAGEDEDDGRNGDRKHSDDSILGYITSSILSNGLGVMIEFKKGNVLPELKDGMLRFKRFNVYSIHPTSPEAGEDEDIIEEKTALKFKANVETMDISLSFGKWYEGKGLIDELEIYGINGKVYKNSEEHQDASVEEYLPFSAGRYNENLHFQYDMNDHSTEEMELVKQKRKNFLMESNYEISHVKIHDSYVEIIDVSNKNPLKISIFNCDLPQLRGNRLLIDFFNANNVTGAINDSMFTIHKRQEFTNPTNDNKIVRFKLDGINMETISHSQKLKFNWIVNGKAEIIADIRLPSVNKESENNLTLGNEYKKISDICSEIFDELIDVTSPSSPEKLPSAEKNDNDNTLLKSALAAIYQTFSPSSESKEAYNTTDPSSEYVIVNFKVKFYNLKACLPQHLPMALSSSLPFIGLQDLRSLIAYVNDNASNKPIIIKTTVIEKLSDLYNIENLSQTKIVDEIVSDVYDNLLKIVKLDEKRIINEKTSSWTHTVASQLLLLGLGVLA